MELSVVVIRMKFDDSKNSVQPSALGHQENPS
jgi:hypothetical protein